MTRKEKMKLCADFWNRLSEEFCKNYSYKQIGSCNRDNSVYLIPNGCEDGITYYGKPVKSFRFSDHWNWYSSIKKCSDPKMVQCCSLDMPWARRRTEEGVATKPIYAIQVAVYGNDNRYHHIYGDRFDRRTKTWEWKENSISDVLQMIK